MSLPGRSTNVRSVALGSFTLIWTTFLEKGRISVSELFRNSFAVMEEKSELGLWGLRIAAWARRIHISTCDLSSMTGPNDSVVGMARLFPSRSKARHSLMVQDHVFASLDIAQSIGHLGGFVRTNWPAQSGCLPSTSATVPRNGYLKLNKQRVKNTTPLHSPHWLPLQVSSFRLINGDVRNETRTTLSHHLLDCPPITTTLGKSKTVSTLWERLSKLIRDCNRNVLEVTYCPIKFHDLVALMGVITGR